LNELPFIEAKEIDLLDDFNNNSLQARPTNVNLRSPFSRAHKFKVQTPTKQGDINDDNGDQLRNVVIKSEKDVATSTSSTTSVVDEQPISEPKKGQKRKKDLADLSIQRLNKTAKNTKPKPKVKTRSQAQTEAEDPEEVA
jgi:hypothetical protein